MTGFYDRVLIAGAGPVGLCLALKLAQDGVASLVIEQLTDANFLDQVPRAGTNHPATLEMYEDIGLYKRLEPRGIIAPLFHYWDRAKGERIAEFDHAVLKNDTRFPFALQCERIKIVEEALAMAKANPFVTVRMGTAFTGFAQDETGVTAFVENEAGEKETIRGSYIVSGEGASASVTSAACCAADAKPQPSMPNTSISTSAGHPARSETSTVPLTSTVAGSICCATNEGVPTVAKPPVSSAVTATRPAAMPQPSVSVASNATRRLHSSSTSPPTAVTASRPRSSRARRRWRFGPAAPRRSR